MKEFTYKITDSAGLHARPAGLLSKVAGEFQSEVIVAVGDKETNASRIFGLMGLEAKCGDELIVRITGADEDNAAAIIEIFMKDNL